MTATQKDKSAPHVYGGADPANRQPPPANGMRCESAGTPLTPDAPNETDKEAANKRGR